MSERKYIGIDKGNTRAWEQLTLDTHTAAGRSFVNRSFDPAIDHEDAAQQALLNTWVKRERLDPDSPRPLAYTTTATLNTIRSANRRRITFSAPFSIEEFEERSAEGNEEASHPFLREPGSIEDDFEIRELREAESNAIESLLARQRTVFILRQVYELSYEEIGRTIGCTSNAAKLLHNRARLQLKTSLEGVK